MRKIICRNCETIFESDRKPTPSLCMDCRSQMKNDTAKTILTCHQCGKEFTRELTVGKPPKFCSPKCRAQSLVSYRSAYFQKRRAEEPAVTVNTHIKRINKQPCIRCGAIKSVTAQMIPHREEIGNLIPLCLDCYINYHEEQWPISEIEDRLKEQYPDQYWWLQIEKSEHP